MRLDLVFMARAYCAVIGATLVAMGLAAWEADRANPYLGALLGGSGLFLIAGTFGRASRLIALLAICALVTGGAGLAGLGRLLLAMRAPAWPALGLIAAEALAAVLAWQLARRLYRG